jgi:hypothetical protein
VAWADQPPNKGQPGATEEKVTGTPNNPNGFGAVVSPQRASTVHDIGEHASGSPPGPDPDKVPAQRLGVGNVARTDGGLADNFGIADPGPHPGDHAAIIGQIDLRSHHPQLIDAATPTSKHQSHGGTTEPSNSPPTQITAHPTRTTATQFPDRESRLAASRGDRPGSTRSGSGVLTAALTCSEVFLDGGHSMDEPVDQVQHGIASCLDAVCVRRRLGVYVLEDRGDPFLDVRAHLAWEFAELALDFTDLALKFTHLALELAAQLIDPVLKFAGVTHFCGLSSLMPSRTSAEYVRYDELRTGMS